MQRQIFQTNPLAQPQGCPKGVRSRDLPHETNQRTAMTNRNEVKNTTIPYGAISRTGARQ